MQTIYDFFPSFHVFNIVVLACTRRMEMRSHNSVFGMVVSLSGTVATGENIPKPFLFCWFCREDGEKSIYVLSFSKIGL
jgi:hypothetical protein